MVTVCTNSRTIWQIPSSPDIQLTYTLVILIYFMYIAVRHIRDEIVIQKHNVIEGLFLLLFACTLESLGTGYLGTVAVCITLCITGSRLKYKPLPTEGKAILITGKSVTMHNSR